MFIKTSLHSLVSNIVVQLFLQILLYRYCKYWLSLPQYHGVRYLTREVLSNPTHNPIQNQTIHRVTVCVHVGECKQPLTFQN